MTGRCKAEKWVKYNVWVSVNGWNVIAIMIYLITREKGRGNMILADKRDYVNGYKKHYSAYRVLLENKGAEKSRKLLLSYSVECGLKYLLLDKWHENNPKDILENKEDRRNKIIMSHNLDKILKELGQAGTFRFPQLATKHHEIVSSEDYHQMCRYGIDVEGNDMKKEEKYEMELKRIAEWIKGGV